MSNLKRIQLARRLFKASRRLLVLANQGKVCKSAAMSMYNKRRHELRTLCTEVRNEIS